jgi:hypothetical protein
LVVDDAAHHQLGVQTYNRCWALLEAEDRTRDQDLELLRTAFTSRYHWSYVAEAAQAIMGDWMISRAAAEVGEGHLALRYARLAYDAAMANDAEDWLLASSAEGMARAFASLEDGDQRDEWFATSEGLVALIVDDESRELIGSQLASVPTCTATGLRESGR